MRWMSLRRLLSSSPAASTISKMMVPNPDDIISQCKQHFLNIATLKESVFRESGQFRITLQLTAKKGKSKLPSMKEINGEGTGQSLDDARRVARAGLAESFLKFSTGHASKGAALYPSDFPTASPPNVISNLFVNDGGQAGTFLHTFSDVWKCSPIREQWVQQNGKFYMALSLDIPENMRTPRAVEDAVTGGCGVGTDNSKAKARSMAKIDLVTRIFPYVRHSDHLVKGRPMENAAKQDVAAGDKSVLVSFPEPIIAQSKQIFGNLEISQIFEAPGEAGVVHRTDTARQSASAKLFPEYTPEQLASLKSMDLPSHFDKTKHLPIFGRYCEILNTIHNNQVTVLSAATGSGKTTQVPQFLLSLYDTFRGSFDIRTCPPSVLVTQPRRIAAISVAQRIAAERGESIGSSSCVGYSVRFQSMPPSGPKQFSHGKIVLCTAGILLRRLQSNPDMNDCSHLIIDEVHERDVFSDILLMLSKGMLRRRPDLKVILMSATLEADKFAAYFEKDGFRVGRINDIGGTNYPVQPVYLEELCAELKRAGAFPASLLPDSTAYLVAEASTDLVSASPIIHKNELAEVPIDIIAETIGWIHRTKPAGAILCFLPGWDEITAVQEYLTSKGLLLNNSVPHKLFLLHSASPQQASDDLFMRTPEYRKIILATNIAESSITIPDAVYVIDSGKQKATFYDAKHRMNVLETCWVSRSNLKQRMGRAGRCQAGHYYSIMSQARADNLLSYFPPELARLNLDEICLGVRAAGVEESCQSFLSKALDPPAPQSVHEAVVELQAIQAFDERQQLTPLGRLLSNIPIHPRTSKMLVIASLFKCVDPVETMVAALGERLTRSTLLMGSKLALSRYLKAASEGCDSDHLTVLSVFNQWLSGSKSMLSVFSEAGLQRLSRSKRSINATLLKSLLDERVDYDANAGNLHLLRFILTSGFYPDVAKYAQTKRNQYKLIHFKTPVMLALTSVNATPPASESADEDAKRRPGETRKLMAARPVFYLYEELFDAGTKRIQKTTAIDPVWLVLFGESIKTQSDGTDAQVTIDGWITVKGSPESVNLLTELRHHYRKFIQFAVGRRLTGKALTGEEQTTFDQFIAFVTAVVSETSDIHRRPQ